MISRVGVFVNKEESDFALKEYNHKARSSWSSEGGTGGVDTRT